MMPLSYEKIEEAATSFLDKYFPNRKIPIPIEEIIEIDLEISIVPIKSLLQLEHIDAFISGDCTTIYIDQDHYINQTNRSRFTLAHEIGHYLMHRSIIEKIGSTQDWRRYILGEAMGRAILETEANNFAGCLLMPKPEILTAYSKYENLTRNRLTPKEMKALDQRTVLSYISNPIAKEFDVSEKAAEIRLSKVVQNSMELFHS